MDEFFRYDKENSFFNKFKKDARFRKAISTGDNFTSLRFLLSFADCTISGIVHETCEAINNGEIKINVKQKCELTNARLRHPHSLHSTQLTSMKMALNLTP